MDDIHHGLVSNRKALLCTCSVWPDKERVAWCCAVAVLLLLLLLLLQALRQTRSGYNTTVVTPGYNCELGVP